MSAESELQGATVSTKARAIRSIVYGSNHTRLCPGAVRGWLRWFHVVCDSAARGLCSPNLCKPVSRSFTVALPDGARCIHGVCRQDAGTHAQGGSLRAVKTWLFFCIY
eukprot:360432-Chlamydomonas_euryale.AAC.2